DDLIQGLTGLPYLTMAAESDDPAYAPFLIADRVAGLHIVNSVLSALFYRLRTGQGKYIEVPMFELLANMILSDHLEGATFVSDETAMGYSRVLPGCRRPFQTTDGYISAVVYTDEH